MALVRQLPSCAKANFGQLSKMYAGNREERNRSLTSLKVKSSSFAAHLQSIKSTKFNILIRVLPLL